MAVDKDELDLWMKISEFRGSTITALHGINKELSEIRCELNTLNKNNSQRDIKVAGIAGGVSMLVVVIGWLAPIILTG